MKSLLVALALVLVCSSTWADDEVSQCFVKGQVESIEERHIHGDVNSVYSKRTLKMKLKILENFGEMKPTEHKSKCRRFKAGKVVTTQSVRKSDLKNPKAIIKEGSILEGKILITEKSRDHFTHVSIVK